VCFEEFQESHKTEACSATLVVASRVVVVASSHAFGSATTRCGEILLAERVVTDCCRIARYSELLLAQASCDRHNLYKFLKFFVKTSTRFISSFSHIISCKQG
jgi:hypothetical protein